MHGLGALGQTGGATCALNRHLNNDAGVKVQNTALDTASFDMTCCTADSQGCAGFSCPAHMTLKTGADSIFTGLSPVGTNTQCCDYNANTCGAHAAVSCGADHSFDTSKVAMTVADDDSNFQAQCCTMNPTVPTTDCAATWQTHVATSTASMIQPLMALAMPLSLLAVLAVGQ
jgi:hypothetical protein